MKIHFLDIKPEGVPEIMHVRRTECRLKWDSQFHQAVKATAIASNVTCEFCMKIIARTVAQRMRGRETIRWDLSNSEHGGFERSRSWIDGLSDRKK